MKPEAIRKIIREHMFEPVALVLDNGNRHLVGNIETITVGDDHIYLLERGGRFLYISPEAVSEVIPIPKSKRSAKWPPRPDNGPGPIRTR